MIFPAITFVSLLYTLFMLFSVEKKHADMNQRLFDSLSVLGLAMLILCVAQVISLKNVPAPYSFMLFIFRVLLFFDSFVYINVSFYFLEQPLEKYRVALKRVRLVLYAVSAVWIFSNSLYVFAHDFYKTLFFWFLSVNSGENNVLSGQMRLFIFSYRVIFPCISVLVLFIFSYKNSVKRQIAFLDILSVLFLFFSKVLLHIACLYNVRFVVFLSSCFICSFLILIRSEKITALFKPRFFIVDCIAFFLRIILPAALCGFLFMLIHDYEKRFFYAYVIFFFFFSLVVFMLSQLINDKFRLHTSSFANRYKAEFESYLALMDFSQKPETITEQLFLLIKKYVAAESLSILLADAGKRASIIYHSSEYSFEVSESDLDLFALLTDRKKDIVFVSDIGIDVQLDDITEQLNSLFKKTKSEAFLILHQGGKITGTFFLGKKISGRQYNAYDRIAFSDLYSYFFVYSYFMQNIMHKQVIGIFDREVKLSSQIIASIQQQMDFPDTSKIDFAYCINPAHEIGGEFVDMIRISENKHVFILGSLSGKGVSAGMNMVIFKNTARAFISKCRDLKSFAEKMNLFILHNLPKETFFAGVFISVDFESGILKYINCGVPSLFMYAKNLHNVIDIQGKGCILGIIPDVHSRLALQENRMRKGDILCACTSGLIDSCAPRGERFGRNRVRHCIADRSDYSANQIMRHVLNKLKAYVIDRPDNDLTMLVLEK